MRKNIVPLCAGMLVLSLSFVSGALGAVSDATFLELCGTGTPKEVRAALAGGADVNLFDENDSTLLMTAAERNPNPEVVTVLAEVGADIHARTRTGWTALFYAARFTSHPEVVVALLQAGADAALVDNRGERAVDVARRNKRLKNTEALQKLGNVSQ
jgi:ankyrin repeat protein